MHRRLGPFFSLAILGASLSHAWGASFTVTNTADPGAGSLRDALNQAASSLGSDTVAFSSLFNTPQTLTLGISMPLLTSSVSFTPTAGLLTINTLGHKFLDLTANGTFSVAYRSACSPPGAVGP